MSDEAEPFLTIQSPGHGDVSLATKEDAIAFVAEEIDYWRWIADHEGETARATWTRFENLLNGFRRSLDDGTYPQQATKIFVTIGLPLKDSDFAAYIADMIKDDPQVALTCLAIATGSIEVAPRSRIYQKASAALVMWDQKLSSESISSARKSLDGLMTKLRRQEVAMRGHATRLLNDIEEAKRLERRSLQLGARYLRNKLRLQRQRDNDRVRASLDDMTATKALYMEHMALSAPVEYWKKKASQHKTQSDTARLILVIFAFAGGAALVAALAIISSYAISVSTAEKPAAVYFILATIGVVITTIVFWSGRVLTRLYLSELHLSMDAAERATMVETYLALTSVNQATKEDRAIVLASLFRPTADGIVKDDAAPDMSPGSIISKVLAPK